MRIGVLGTGIVGSSIATKLVAVGHDVMMGSRTADNERVGWPRENILDLGGIAAARGTEGYVLLWLRLYGAVGSGNFNIKVER